MISTDKANGAAPKLDSSTLETPQPVVGSLTTKPATIGKFGIQKLCENETNLLDHLDSVHIGCQWTHAYVSRYTSTDKIIHRLVELLEGKEFQLGSFIKC